MMPSGFERPTVCCTMTGVALFGVWFNVELIDLMSLVPVVVTLVFQMGNLLLTPPVDAAQVDDVQRRVVDDPVEVPGMLLVLRSSM